MYLFILYHLILTGANPSCHQVTVVSTQGHIWRQTTIGTHTLINGQFRANNDPNPAEKKPENSEKSLSHWDN